MEAEPDTKPATTRVEDINLNQDDVEPKANTGGPQLFQNNAVVLIPTPSPDPKGKQSFFI